MINKVEICGVDTSKLPTIPEGEVEEYFRRIQSGDTKAREEFIKGNLRLVLSVIQRFGGRGENLDDLFQVGCIGLVKSIDNFNLSYMVKFSTYAVPMIIGELRRYLRDNNSIRVSRSLRDTAYRALAIRNRIIAERCEEPTVDEIAKEMDMKREDIVFALDAIADPVSLFEPVYHDGGDTLYVMDQLQDEKAADEIWLENIALREAIGKLPEREKNIIYRRFFEGKTQMEVSKELGISQAQISRLEKSAVRHIRNFV